MASRRCAAPLVALALFVLSHHARAQVVVPSEWNTGNGNWNVAGNWFPNDVPDDGGGFTYDVQIGNRPVAAGAGVSFIPEDGTSDTVTSLTISGAADLLTNGFQVFVVGQTTVNGVGSTIRIDPHATPGTFSLDTDNLDLIGGGGIQMEGGTVNVDVLFEINAASQVQGHGVVDVGDGDAVVEEALENSGIIHPTSNSAAPRTLTLQTNGVDTIDLDGDTDGGVLDVDDVSANANVDTTTLVIDAPLSDAFSGTLQIGQRDTVTFAQNFTLSGADVAMNGGANVATLNGVGDATSIAVSNFTITGDAVIDNDMTFSGTLNTIVLTASSTLTLNGTVSIPDASALDLTAASQTLVIGGATTITEAAGDFNWDDAVTTVQGTGQLTLTVDQIDLGNDAFNGVLNLNDDGDVTVNVTATEWTMDGFLDKNNAGTSTVSGDRIIVIGTVNGNAGSLLLGTTTLGATGAINIDAGATVSLGINSVLAGPAVIQGAGLFRLASTSTVTGNMTVNSTSFDWDGLGSGTGHIINDGVVFTVNSTVWDPDDTGDVDDNITLGGNGAQIIVNNIANWTMVRTLTTNTPDVGVATIGGTSRVTFSSASGILNVNGNTDLAARVTFGAFSTTNIAATQLLTLKGGSDADANEMAGGTINGPGTLSADTGKVLRGFGTINSIVDFNGDADLVASGGLLDVNGNINDVGTLRTSGGAAILDLPAGFSTNVTDDGILMAGGTVQGGAVTVAALAKPLRGFGAVVSQLDNNGAIESQSGTLILDNALSDYDGTAGGVGQLRAASNSVLEIQDNATFGFTGDVIATDGGRVFTNGFALDFNVGSLIQLTQATYESTHSTDIGGQVTVGAGGDSTIEVENNRFLTFETGSATTLNGNLRLVNNNINVEAGATFSGGGALIVPDGSHMVADNLADVGVLLDMRGGFRPGNSEGIGRIDLLDYQQASTGKLFVEIKGTALNAFDRLVASGDVVLDGYLNIDIDEIAPMTPFVPVLGQTFNIITGNTVTGEFDFADISGMPNGLTFHIEYLANAVQLQVVSTPLFSADFDDDGDVDPTDLAIWDGAFDLNQLGDADGDNDSDGNDFLLWQRQLGSAPAVVAAAAVPEPGALLLSLLALAALAKRRD